MVLAGASPVFMTKAITYSILAAGDDGGGEREGNL
jgi:hypothetical protein